MKTEHYKPDSPVLQEAFPFISIEKGLGEGGQKYVYKAYNKEHGTIAFKVIKASQDQERTIREISAAEKFSPPNFPSIYKYGKGRVGDDEVIFIIEEYLQGKSLRELLNSEPMTQERAIRIGFKLMLALKEVAENRLVHRDVKPENIMICERERVVLLDFGIARHLLLSSLTQDAAVFGPMTPGYAAPEQIKNEKRSISPRTDFFAWGVVMYEMLAGFNPFNKGCSNLGQVLQNTLSLEPPPLDKCHSSIRSVTEWCLKKQLHRRPATAELILERLKEIGI